MDEGELYCIFLDISNILTSYLDEQLLNELFLEDQQNIPVEPVPETQLSTILQTIEQCDEYSIDDGNTIIKECLICYEPNMESEVVKLPCNHIFHKKCILQWFKLKNTCPLCRTLFAAEEEEEEEKENKLP